KQSGIDSTLIDALQYPRSDVGTKITAISKIGTSQADELSKYMQAETETGPLWATVLDLTRHSDKELAYEATQLVKKANLEQYVARSLSSDNGRLRRDGEVVLAHVNPLDANRLSLEFHRAHAGQKIKVQHLALVPTNFPDGDRYYMQVTWDPKNEKQVRCVAKFFSNSLDIAGSPEQEAKKMSGRGQR